MNAASTNPVAAMLMGGGVPQQQQSAPMQPGPSVPMQPGNPPVTPPNAAPRSEIQPSPTVWGDKEAVAAGLYDDPAAIPKNANPIQYQAPQHSGGDPNMAALYMNPSVPNGVKTTAMAGQVPGQITAANGDIYLWKPGMPQPIFLMKGQGPSIKVPGFEGPINAGQPAFGGASSTPPTATPPVESSTPSSVGNAMPPTGGPQALAEWGMRNAAEAERQKTQASEGAKAAMVPIGEAMKEVKTAPQALNAVNVIEDVAKQYGDRITTGPAADAVLKVKQAVNGIIGSDVKGVASGAGADVNSLGIVAGAEVNSAGGS